MTPLNSRTNAYVEIHCPWWIQVSYSPGMRPAFQVEDRGAPDGKDGVVRGFSCEIGCGGIQHGDGGKEHAIKNSVYLELFM